ncbi:MAG: hypothetical protein ACE5JP_00120 [Candidatus Bipolaricaulia bacterium]
MLISERHGFLAPFPRIPNSIKAKYSNNGLSLRLFGFFEDDLEIDFNQKVRPHLVTQILQCYTINKNGETPDLNFFWDLTIGKRIECLLTIVTLTLGSSSKLSVRLRCPSETCQQQMEIEISMDELASLQHQADDTDHFMIQIGDESLLIRRPTGRDQLEWLKRSFMDEDTAVKSMIRTLVLDNEKAVSNEEYPILDEWVQTINETMEELDPLVNFSLSVPCPYCSREGHYEFNLEELSLHKLHEAQLNLLQTVHHLAFHYHWSEQQIFSLPPWRRSYYLALIEKEGNR